jgi:hypothetical protein
MFPDYPAAALILLDFPARGCLPWRRFSRNPAALQIRLRCALDQNTGMTMMSWPLAPNGILFSLNG